MKLPTKPARLSSAQSQIILVCLFSMLCVMLILVIGDRLSGQADAEVSLQGVKPSPTPDAAEAAPRPKPVQLSKQVVEYHIGVHYDEKKQMLIGEETVTWKHPGEKPVAELYFHLYPNAFESASTTFMTESGGKLRDTKMKSDRYASMTITSIKSMQGEELLHRMQAVQPDDGNANDRTLMKLRLPDAVQPGTSATYRILFTVRLPEPFARMGAIDDYVMAGQWFPKLAVYEPAGTRDRSAEGWSLHQYHGNSEYYSDFGSYSVAINVPEAYTVAATGFPTKPAVKKNGRKTYQFYADDVHDFAWAASPKFIYAEEPFSNAHVPGVKIKLYLDPQHEHLKERYLRAAKLALSRYSEWYGAYPYSTLTIVVPPAGAEGSGGMEYPTLITAWAAVDEAPGMELEQVVAHEIAHQYWYGMVATNEMEEAWLDETFASYSEQRLMQIEYDVRYNLPLEAVHITSPAPLKLDAWKYVDHRQYAANVYSRGKLVLLSIEREIGSEMMRKVLRSYFQKWRFKHPATSDFQQALEDVTKRSWQDFFEQFVYGRAMLDYEVKAIQMKPIEKNGKSMYEYTVTITRNGGYHESVPILFYFADKSTVSREWAGQELSIRYKLTSDSKLSWVAIDHQHDLLMENKHYNNILLAEVDETWKIRFNFIIGKTIEALLGWAL